MAVSMFALKQQVAVPKAHQIPEKRVQLSYSAPLLPSLPGRRCQWQVRLNHTGALSSQESYYRLPPAWSSALMLTRGVASSLVQSLTSLLLVS